MGQEDQPSSSDLQGLTACPRAVAESSFQGQSWVGTQKMSPSPSPQLPIGLHFEQRRSELLILETQDLGNCAIWDGKNHTCALVGNPKLKSESFPQDWAKKHPHVSNLPTSQRALFPSVFHLNGHVPADQRERVTSLPNWEWKMPSQEAGRGCQYSVM